MIPVLIIVGGGSGAVLRWMVTLWLGTTTGGFPLGTTAVNVVGSFFLGVLVGLDTTIGGIDPQPLTVGVLGGFTTFSTWMVQIADEDDMKMSGIAAVVPGILGVGAAAVGVGIGRFISG